MIRPLSLRVAARVERWGLRSPSGVIAAARHRRRSPLIRAQKERRGRGSRRLPFTAGAGTAADAAPFAAATRYSSAAAAATAAAATTTTGARSVPQLLRGGTDAENAGSDGGAARVAANGPP